MIGRRYMQHVYVDIEAIRILPNGTAGPAKLLQRIFQVRFSVNGGRITT